MKPWGFWSPKGWYQEKQRENPSFWFGLIGLDLETFKRLQKSGTFSLGSSGSSCIHLLASRKTDSKNHVIWKLLLTRWKISVSRPGHSPIFRGAFLGRFLLVLGRVGIHGCAGPEARCYYRRFAGRTVGWFGHFWWVNDFGNPSYVKPGFHQKRFSIRVPPPLKLIEKNMLIFVDKKSVLLVRNMWFSYRHAE